MDYTKHEAYYILKVDDFWVASFPKSFSQRLQKGRDGKGVANNTYKSCSGMILGFNDYGWKDS
jgi:hypothetical protein